MDITVPDMGESITEAKVARWLKQPGDTVTPGEPLVELETDKVMVEVPAPGAGVLGALAAPEGATVQVGQRLGSLDGAPTGKTSQPNASQPMAKQPTASGSGPHEGPAVRRMAAEQHINLAEVPASAKGGRHTKGDLLHYLDEHASPQATPSVSAPAHASQTPIPSAQPRERREAMTPLRKRIAERLKQAQNTAAMLTTFNEVDMTQVMALRAKYKEDFKEKHGAALGFMSFFTKAAVEALKAFPAVNAEIDGGDIVYKNYYDIGVAVGTDRGLVVPIVRGADRLAFIQIEKEIARLAALAREGRLALGDLTGGTFTISNGGVYGSMLSTPILNPPQSAILGLHNIVKRPVVAEGDQITVRSMMYLALSYDHRIIDGSEAVRFLVKVKQCVEDPARMLLEI
ncbi:MAG: 2-oxoglutarate dehydrogenase complex dihydrolipoyllysine-residue succinyltransferase [Deltaproteobacteria bacterium]|nr:2-oxoglutarate dehydrogenase complex dihydrolipoyllysine-residue succinyltransferase [Deltaproteobacteria bacterium]